MKSVFMVAEKPSLAQSLAEILSNNHLNSHKGKYLLAFYHNFVIFSNTNFFRI